MELWANDGTAKSNSPATMQEYLNTRSDKSLIPSIAHALLDLQGITIQLQLTPEAYHIHTPILARAFLALQQC
jgi:hypothetical protein